VFIIPIMVNGSVSELKRLSEAFRGPSSSFSTT